MKCQFKKWLSNVRMLQALLVWLLVNGESYVLPLDQFLLTYVVPLQQQQQLGSCMLSNC